MPLDQGPVVLFGRNGSGKTFLLQALEDCFNGYMTERVADASPALVVDFWARKGEAERYWTRLDASEYLAPGEHERDAFLRATTRASSPEWATLGETPDMKRIFKELARLVDVWGDVNGYKQDSAELQLLAEAMVGQWTYLLRPDGTKSRPSWTAELAAFSSRHPLLETYAAEQADGPLHVTRTAIDTPCGRLGHALGIGRVFDSDLLGAPLCLFRRPKLPANQAARARLTWELRLGERLQAETDAGQDALAAQGAVLDAALGAKAASADEGPPRLFDDMGNVSGWVLRWCQEVSQSASRFFHSILPNSPALSLEMAPRLQWVQGPMFRWMTRMHAEAEPLPLEWASETEQRWATIAVDFALYPGQAQILILDEPEQGLHRSAEGRAVDALVELGRTSGATPVIASHSPSFLNAPDVTVIKLNRAGSFVTDRPVVQYLQGIDRDELDSLGLLPSDLLQQVRAFLLVEGQHEVEILEGLIGLELKRLGVEVLPLDKGSHLKDSTAAGVLFRFSDAPVVAMLDNLPPERLRTLWSEAVGYLKRNGLQSARDYLGEAMQDMPEPEGPWMRRFLTNALVENRAHRVHPWALPAGDVLEYLPASQFLPGARNWEDLKAKACKNAGRQLSGTDLKKWLRAQGADLSESRIRRLASLLSLIHI